MVSCYIFFLWRNFIFKLVKTSRNERSNLIAAGKQISKQIFYQSSSFFYGSASKSVDVADAYKCFQFQPPRAKVYF